MSWIQTFTGKKFDLLNPDPEMVCIRDIAHSLSHICRFGGHTDRFYSVAQHSLIVSQCCQPWDALWGLLHDASEAYVGDITRPLKYELPEYSQIERRIQATIATRFGLIGRDPNEFLRTRERVKFWDDTVLATEARDLLQRPPVTDGSVLPGVEIDGRWGWCKLPDPMLDQIWPAKNPDVVKLQFLWRFEELYDLHRKGAV